jgi:hypothetical protein
LLVALQAAAYDGARIKGNRDLIATTINVDVGLPFGAVRAVMSMDEIPVTIGHSEICHKDSLLKIILGHKKGYVCV